MNAEYVNHMGDDLTTVNAARVSMDKESEWEQVCCGDGTQNGLFSPPECCGYPDLVLSEKDKKLISYLSKHNHFTPFTHSVITLRETVPIFVARQRFKHTVGFTYNEVSRRYVDDTPEFYIPDVWREKAENVKQGSGGASPLSNLWSNAYEQVIEICEDTYNRMIEDGIAPEQARMILPQSMYTSYYVTGSLYAFARAYKLRIDPHAQKEIRDLAEQWDSIIRPLYPVSWAALVDGDDNAKEA